MGNSWLRSRTNGNVSASGCGEPIPPSVSLADAVQPVRITPQKTQGMKLWRQSAVVSARGNPWFPHEPPPQKTQGMKLWRQSASFAPRRSGFDSRRLHFPRSASAGPTFESRPLEGT